MRHEPNRVTAEELARAASIANKFSDRGETGLRAWAAHFVAAHYRQPHGLSIEVGTNIGGSALLFGQLLELMYGPATADIPSLWTVDPYGSKPYVGGHGDSPQAQPPIYTDEFYQAMKHNLGGAAYHAHWLMTSTSFFQRILRLEYWRPGPELLEVIEVGTGKPLHLPIGEVREADNATFILLDGEHSADSIINDFQHAMMWVGRKGTIVIDNIDTDPRTIPELSKLVQFAPASLRHGTDGWHLDASAREWAVLTRVVD